MAKKSRVTKQTRRICNLVPSRDTHKDWTFEAAVESAAVTAVAAPPTSKDLRVCRMTRFFNMRLFLNLIYAFAKGVFTICI